MKCSWQCNLDNRDTDIDQHPVVIFWAIGIDKIWKYFHNHHRCLPTDIYHCIHYILWYMLRKRLYDLLRWYRLGFRQHITLSLCLLHRWYIYKSDNVKFICPISTCRLDYIDNDWCCGNTIRFYRDCLLRKGYQPHDMTPKIIADTLLSIWPHGICCYNLGHERRFIYCQMQSHNNSSLWTP